MCKDNPSAQAVNEKMAAERGFVQGANVNQRPNHPPRLPGMDELWMYVAANTIHRVVCIARDPHDNTDHIVLQDIRDGSFSFRSPFNFYGSDRNASHLGGRFRKLGHWFPEHGKF